MRYTTCIMLLAALLLPGARGGAAPQSEAIRDIPVTLVTDAPFRELRNSRGLAQGALALATEDLEQEVGIRFTLGKERTWEIPDSATTLAMALQAALTDLRPVSGIMVVLIGPRVGAGGAERGYAFLGKPAVLVVTPGVFVRDEKKELALFIRHELGHMFGIPHLQGRSIMKAMPDTRTWKFGELGLDVLRANREMDFTGGTPFSGCDLARLRDVYMLLDKRGQMESALLLELARAFEKKGQLGGSEPLYEAALQHDGMSASARIGIAHCAMARQDTSKVLVLAHDLARMNLSPGQQSALGQLWIEVDPSGARRREALRYLQADQGH